MVIVGDEYVDLPTPSGSMRTHILRPVARGRYPAIVFYSEIFQVTAPIRRTAAMLAGHGYIVAVPEVYHEYEAAGVALAYDQAGSDRGNFLKTHKPLAAYDADARSAIEYLLSRPDCTGKVGAMGICLGGHLAFRAAMHPDVAATVCFYATDIHSGTLGEGKHDDSLARARRDSGRALDGVGTTGSTCADRRPDEAAGPAERVEHAPELARSQWRARVSAGRGCTVRPGACACHDDAGVRLLSSQARAGRPACHGLTPDLIYRQLTARCQRSPRASVLVSTRA